MNATVTASAPAIAPHNAPVPSKGCPCLACRQARIIIERDRRLDADLAANYAKYLRGDLVRQDDGA